jgi:hypothetical protein
VTDPFPGTASVRWFVILVGVIPWSANAAVAELPRGDARPALESCHFPTRLHEFVWRNWGVVDAAKLAKVVSTSEAELTAIATSMGLPAAVTVVPAMRTRGYVTIIRRNWHLLPYEQLLELLDLTADQLDVMLREEDFLWVKLGRVKPQCDPLYYRAPDAGAIEEAATIRRVVAEEFGTLRPDQAVPRFDFVRKLAEPVVDGGVNLMSAAVGPPDAKEDALRIVYSYVAVYGDPLMDPSLNRTRMVCSNG